MILNHPISKNILEIIRTAFLTSYPGKAEIVLYALCGIFGITGLIFLFVSVYSFIILTYPAYIAGLIVAAIALALAFIAIFFASKKSKKREQIAQARNEMEILNSLISGLESGEIASLLQKPVSENPKTALILASLAGFVAGDKIL